MTIHRLDLSGQRFGRLTVIEIVGSNKHKQIIWRCICDCGNETFVTATSLNQGNVRSCGCLRRDTTRANKTIHGHRYERLYGIWKHMNKRCYNVNDKAYNRYGARGIYICDDWRDNYESFRDLIFFAKFTRYIMEEGYCVSLFFFFYFCLTLRKENFIMGCCYCNSNESLIERDDHFSSKRDFYPGIDVFISDDLLCIEAVPDSYEPIFMEREVKINFCPMCGEKLS